MYVPKGFIPDIQDEEHLQYLLKGPQPIPVVNSVEDFPEATNLFYIGGKRFLISDPDCEPRMKEELRVYLRRCGTRIREYQPKDLKRSI